MATKEVSYMGREFLPLVKWNNIRTDPTIRWQRLQLYLKTRGKAVCKRMRETRRVLTKAIQRQTINYSKRRATTARPPISEGAYHEVATRFQREIRSVVTLHNIPESLILTLD
eukprot:sb/3476939/